MAEINVNIASAKADVEKFTTANNSLKTSYANLRNNVAAGISEFNICYFDELEAFVNDMHLKNDRYQLGANQYFDTLTDFESSIDYENGELTGFPTMGGADKGGSVSDTTGGGNAMHGGEISEDDYDGGQADGDAGDADTGRGINDDDSNVDDADGKTGRKDTGDGIDDADGDVSLAEGDAGDAAVGTGIDDASSDVGDADAESGDKDSGSTITDGDGSVTGADGRSHGGNTRSDDIPVGDQDVAEALSEEEGEDLLAKLLADADQDVTSAQGHSAAAGLAEAINGTGQDVHKGGVGIGALAAVLGTIAAGGAGIGALAKGGHGETGTSITDGKGNIKLDNKNLSPEMKGMLGEIAAATTGHTVSELMSGNYPEAVTGAINSVNTVMNVVTEAGIVSAEETKFAMEGMPYQLAKLSPKQLDALYLQLGDLIDKYGGVDAFVESAQAKAFIEDMATSYDAIKNILGKDPAEVRRALQGLLDPNTPNIGGVPISREVRDFIVKYLQEATGISIAELLNGQHDNELLKALEDLMEVLEVFKCLTGLTKEELRKFLYDILNGKFPELSGITPFTAKTLRDYLARFSQGARIPIRELYTVPARSESLRQGIREFSSAKGSFKVLAGTTMEAQDICAKVVRGELVNLNGRNIDSVATFLIKSALNIMSRYEKCSIDVLVTDPKYKPVIADLIKNLLKYTVFNGMFATLKPDMLLARTAAMFTGKSFGLNGFTFVDIETIKTACEDFAFKDNIKVNDLYTNKAHAAVFKQILAASDVFIKLMLIFENLSDSDVQILINNLITSWKEEFKERLQNLLNYANKKRVDRLISEVKEETISNMRVVSEEALKGGLDKLLELNGEAFYDALLDIYQGKKLKIEITPELIFLIKLFLTIISINQKLAVKDLMKNEDAKFLIKELFPYIRLYPSKLSNRGDLFKLKPLSEFIGAVLGGYYPDLLGYSGDKYKAVVDAYYGMAQRKGINVKDLLGNLSHAVEVATTVANDQKNRVIAVFVREIPEIPTQRFMLTFILNSKK